MNTGTSTPETISHDSIAARIGNTPLIRLDRISAALPSGVEIFAKAEHLNPGGSVKDRPALAMILDAERRGLLRPGKTILDASSGNTGIAYGMIAVERGYDVTLCLPGNASSERKQILNSYGVEVIETNPMEGTDGAQALASNLAREFPDRYVYLDQYNNDANWRAHYETTGKEIWQQTQGRVTHFLAGLGTTGTFTGITRRLREHNQRVTAIALQPDCPLHGIEGLKHLPTVRVPGIYDPSLADEQITVETEDALRMKHRLAQEEGLFVGPSSGANIFAALRLASSLPSGSVIVTILCDDGARYLSENREEQPHEPPRVSADRF
jgi:S-sulfo-L-cysteine synthase (O-acetyl-L-serine-dependent)